MAIASVPAAMPKGNAADKKGMNRHGIVRVWTVFLILSSAGSVRADRFLLLNGKSFQGDVVTEDKNTITVEIDGRGSGLTQVFVKAQIKQWIRDVHEGQAYVLVPLCGEIGNDVTVDALRAGLNQARATKARQIILAIDSPGGDVGQMVGMIDLLNDASKDLSITAYVKNAHSAAAVIAMSCRHVYMMPGATLGATVPFRMTATGPKDVDSKFRSIIEAQMRAANEHGGHPDLLIRGMSEIDLELFLSSEDGKPS